MTRPDRLIFVCTNVRPQGGKESCAGHNGGEELAAALKDELRNRNLKSRLRVVRTSCMGPCDGGPHAMVAPDNIWYAGAGPEDVEEIVTEHLLGGRPVERLLAPEPEEI